MNKIGDAFAGVLIDAAQADAGMRAFRKAHPRLFKKYREEKSRLIKERALGYPKRKRTSDDDFYKWYQETEDALKALDLKMRGRS